MSAVWWQTFRAFVFAGGIDGVMRGRPRACALLATLGDLTEREVLASLERGTP